MPRSGRFALFFLFFLWAFPITATAGKGNCPKDVFSDGSEECQGQSGHLAGPGVQGTEESLPGPVHGAPEEDAIESDENMISQKNINLEEKSIDGNHVDKIRMFNLNSELINTLSVNNAAMEFSVVEPVSEGYIESRNKNLVDPEDAQNKDAYSDSPEEIQLSSMPESLVAAIFGVFGLLIVARRGYLVKASETDSLLSGEGINA